jgi:hypothetical protein
MFWKVHWRQNRPHAGLGARRGDDGSKAEMLPALLYFIGSNPKLYMQNARLPKLLEELRR